MTIKLRADDDVLYKGPVDAINNTVLDNASGATCLFRLYDQSDRTTVAAAATRLRTDVAAAGTTWLVPNFNPAWIEVGDTVDIVDDKGNRVTTTVSTYTPGTDDETETTNFDTMVVAAGPTAAAKAGSIIRLRKKGSTSSAPQIPVKYPVNAVTGSLDPATTQIIEIEEDDLTLYESTTETGWRKVRASEDGDLASDQPEIFVVSMTVGLSGNVSVGQRVRHKLGADTAMAEYGTPVAGSADWGWTAKILDTDATLLPGTRVQVEIHFTGSGGGLDDVVSTVETVVE